MKKLLLLLCALGVTISGMSQTYELNGDTKLVVDGTTATIDVKAPGDIGAITNWYYPVNFTNALSGVKTLVVKGVINQSDFTNLSGNVLGGFERVDLSQTSGYSMSSFDGSYKQLILPEGSNISSVPYTCEYIIIVSDAGATVVVQSGHGWADDVYVQAACPINVSISSNPNPNSLDLTSEVTTLRETKEVTYNNETSGNCTGGSAVDLEVNVTNGEVISTKVSSTLGEGNTIKKLTIIGEISPLDVLRDVSVKSIDFSGVTNTGSNFEHIVLPTTKGEIILPNGVSYSGNTSKTVSTTATTTLDQLKSALKLLANNTKEIIKINLPGGSTFENGKLTLTSADVSSLADIVQALKEAGLTVSEVDFPGGSTFASGELTISANEDNMLKTYADAIRSVKALGTGYEAFDITSAKLKSSDISWVSANGGTLKTTENDETAQNAQKKKFTDAGFPVTEVVVLDVEAYITHSGKEFYQIKVSTAGTLQNKLKAVPVGTDNLYIEGQLNANDLTALHDMLQAKGVKNLCMDMATVEGGNYNNLDFSGNTVIENIILPNAMAAQEPTVFEGGGTDYDFPKGTDANGKWMRSADARMFHGCTSLNAAIAISKDGTGGEDEGTGSTVLAYVGTPGKLKETSDFIHRVNIASKIETIKMAGNMNSDDLQEKLLNGYDQAPKNIDLSRAVFQNSENLNIYNNTANWRDKIQTLKLPEVQVHELGDSISNQAFFNCKELTEIVIPGNYRVIGEGAFMQCGKLKQIDIGTGGDTNIELIGKNAFRQCPSIEYVYFGELVNELTFGEACFYEGKAMKHITVPEGTIAIGDKAFYDLENLSAVRLPETLKTIGDESFCQCHKIESIVIPKNVESIGKAAFVQCDHLKHLFLMTPADKPLPRIWPAVQVNYNGHDQGTFEGIQLFNAASGPVGLTDTGTTDETTGQKTVSDTWADGCLAYKNAGAGATVLHFVQAEKKVDGKMVPDKEVNDARFGVSISDTYYYKTSDGFTLPKHEPTGTTGYGDDYAKRLQAAFEKAQVEGGSTNGIIKDGDKTGTEVDEYKQSAAGWKQFILMKGESQTTPSQILTRQYDDTWYTMCFPFNLTPGQLETAFGASYEICEFTGVEVVDEDDENKALILHFMDVPKQEEASKVIAFAAHPYMIHPNTKIGSGGKKTDCEFVNIKYLDVKPITAAQAKTATPQTGGTASISGGNDSHNEGSYSVTHYVTWEATKGFKSDEPGNIGNRRGTDPFSPGAAYTFVGTFNEDGTDLIPYGAYFLGCERDKDASGYMYPKYYRETAPDSRTSGGLWRQYTAIIIPNELAVANIENGVSSAGAKGFNLGFNDYETDIEYKSETDIQDILNDAREKGQKVEYMDVIFNINGQVVGKGSAALKNLPKGLYIVNGKKYFVK